MADRVHTGETFAASVSSRSPSGASSRVRRNGRARRLGSPRNRHRRHESSGRLSVPAAVARASAATPIGTGRPCSRAFDAGSACRRTLLSHRGRLRLDGRPSAVLNWFFGSQQSVRSRRALPGAARRRALFPRHRSFNPRPSVVRPRSPRRERELGGGVC